MQSQSLRVAHSRRIVTFCGIAGALGGLALAGVGLSRWNEDFGIWMMVGGLVVVLGSLIAIGLMEALLKIESNSQRQHSELLDIKDVLTSHQRTLEEIGASVSISDSAKSIAHRDKELDALRQAVRDDIRMEKWDTALYLVAEMQRRFGSEDEANRMREEVAGARAKVLREKLKQAIAHIEDLFDQRHWAHARKEIDRLHRVLPDEPHVSGLYEAMQRRRQEHKKELLDSWTEALRRDDIDGGIEILKELDQYLTREEAASLEGSARDVFKRKLLQMRFRFQYAVQEQRWVDALDVATSVIAEYPNSKMAQELREKIPVLRLRSGLPADGEASRARPVTPSPETSASL